MRTSKTERLGDWYWKFAFAADVTFNLNFEPRQSGTLSDFARPWESGLWRARDPSGLDDKEMKYQAKLSKNFPIEQEEKFEARTLGGSKL